MIIIGSWQRKSNRWRGPVVKGMLVHPTGESHLIDINIAHTLYTELYRYKDGEVLYIVFGSN